MRLFSVVGVLILLFSLAGVALGGVPSASTSTVERAGQGTPSCNPNIAVGCPLGDWGSVEVTVTVRDVYGDPLPGETVNCQAVPASGMFCFQVGQTPQAGVTDSSGVVQFIFIRFGGCGNLQFTADCDDVAFSPSPSIYIAGPDANGSCRVTAADFALFAAYFATARPCSDYNCDGSVNGIDFGLFAAHYTH